MSFEYPIAFLLAVIVLPLLYFGPRSIRFSATGFLGKTAGAPLYRTAERAFFMVAALGMIAALAGPKVPGGSEKRWTRERDFLLLLDVSASMADPFEETNNGASKDGYGWYGFHGWGGAIAPQKMNPKKTKQFIAQDIARQFVVKHFGDRIGLMIFSDNAHLMHPLSRNHDSLIDWLLTVHAYMEGTEIPLALARAAEHMAERGGARGARAIILLSDGEDPGILSKIGEISKSLRETGIRLWWFRIKTRGKESSMPDFEIALKKIAEQGGGGVYDVTSEDEMQKAFRAVSIMESRPVLGEYHVPFRTLAPLCILIAGIAVGAFLVVLSARLT